MPFWINWRIFQELAKSEKYRVRIFFFLLRILTWLLYFSKNIFISPLQWKKEERIVESDIFYMQLVKKMGEDSISIDSTVGESSIILLKEKRAGLQSSFRCLKNDPSLMKNGWSRFWSSTCQTIFAVSPPTVFRTDYVLRKYRN